MLAGVKAPILTGLFGTHYLRNSRPNERQGRPKCIVAVPDTLALVNDIESVQDISLSHSGNFNKVKS